MDFKRSPTQDCMNLFRVVLEIGEDSRPIHQVFTIVSAALYGNFL